MSKVISFRLNPENPRDARALAVLQEWLSQGFSTRHTITEALLLLDSGKPLELDSRAFNDLSNQIQKLLVRFETGSTHDTENVISSKERLSDGFIASIVKAAKPGLSAGA